MCFFFFWFVSQQSCYMTLYNGFCTLYLPHFDSIQLAKIANYSRCKYHASIFSREKPNLTILIHCLASYQSQITGIQAEKKRAFHSSRQGLENDELKPTKELPCFTSSASLQLKPFSDTGKNPIQHKVFQSFLPWRCQQFRYLKLMWFCFGLHMLISLGRAAKSLCLSKISLDSLLVIVLFNHQCMYLCISDKSLFYWVCMYVFFCNKRLHIFSNMVILSMFPDCGEERHWKNLIKS